MDLLLSDGEGLCRDVPYYPELPAVGGAGEHRESLRAGDTSLLHDRRVGAVQRSAVGIGLLEVPVGRHVSECVPEMEGADAELRCGVAARTRGAESVSKGDPRGNREVRRRLRGVPVRHDQGQGDALPSPLPRGLPATVPEDQRQLPDVQARTEIRLSNAEDSPRIAFSGRDSSISRRRG